MTVPGGMMPPRAFYLTVKQVKLRFEEFHLGDGMLRGRDKIGILSGSVAGGCRTPIDSKQAGLAGLMRKKELQLASHDGTGDRRPAPPAHTLDANGPVLPRCNCLSCER